MIAPSNPNARPQGVDFHDLASVQGQLHEISQNILALVPDVAKARTVAEYDGDRRKRILARAMRPHFRAKKSATESEQLARADEECEKELDQCRADYQTAQETLEHNRALYCQFDAMRTIASGLKAAAGL